MRFRPVSVVTALAISLLVHGIITSVALWEAGPDDGDLTLPPLPRPERLRVATQLGEAAGTGWASNLSPGDRLMKAQEAEVDQALLSLDDIGHAPIGAMPSEWTGPTGNEGAHGKTDRSFTPLPRESSIPRPFGPDLARETSQTPKRPARPLPGFIARSPDRAPPATAPAEPPEPDSAVASAAPPKPKPDPHDDAPAGTPGRNVASADAAPKSDSESDPFAKIGSVTFEQGRVDVRFGRKVKTVRPRFTLAGRYDLYARFGPTVVTALQIDESGAVKNVQILRSSGSNEIDLPIQRAMFEWWIEPAKDADGNPVPDVAIFTITLR